MAGPWERYSQADGPWKNYGPSVGIAEDMARSGAAGVRQGVESGLGMFGDAAGWQGQLAGWLAGKLGATSEWQQTARSVGEAMHPAALLPSTEELRSVGDATIGESYQPQTTAGEYARTAGQFLPSAVAGGGGAARVAANTIVPAVLSETAGQLTEDTAAEPWARAAGAIGGAGLSAVLTPKAASGNVVADALDGVTAQQIDDAERLFQIAQREGVPITRFEAVQQVTGAGTRAGDLQRVLEGRGALKEFFAARPQQIDAAARRTADAITPPTAQPSNIGPVVSDVAETVVTDTRKAINAATEPLYTAASTKKIPAADFSAITNAPGWKEARDAVRNDPQLARYVKGLPEDSVGFLNEVQKYLRQQGDNAAGSINAQQNMQRAAGYGSDAETVRSAAERASPEFAKAVAEQARLRKTYLDPLMAGPIGKLAGKDKTTSDAINALFPRNPLPNSEAEIGRTMGVLAKRNPGAARQLMRAHVESTFNQAARDLQAGANQWGGAGFVAALRGNRQQAANLEAAIRAMPNGAKTWDGVSRFLDILAATGQRQRIGSNTSFNNELLREMSQGKGLETAATVVAGGGLNWPRKAMDAAEAWRLGRNVEQIAQLIVDPRAGDLFRRLAVEGAGDKALKIGATLVLMGNASRADPPGKNVR